MLFPPDNFQPAAARLYLWQIGLAPAVCVLAVFGGWAAMLVFLALIVPGVLAGGAAAWLSVYGSRHAILGGLTIWCFFYLPLAMALPLLPSVAGGRGVSGAALAVAGIQALVLLAATVWFWWRSPLPGPGARQVDWPGVRIDLAKRLIRRSEAPSSLKLGGAAAALASVPLYHALQPYLESGAGLTALALAMNLLFAGLAAVTVARPLAQGLRLRAIERESGLCVTGQLPELERLRQRYAIGRWLRRQVPLSRGGGGQAWPGVEKG
ncbi:MAG: hypothetical protein PHR30_17440 [Gallionellaceae bacterium]|nr:hypothetical protein [Gallionellaceae bacterium]MDD5367123.1 hypothetical protein [Gallionellaceae bacterium]